MSAPTLQKPGGKKQATGPSWAAEQVAFMQRKFGAEAGERMRRQLLVDEATAEATAARQLEAMAISEARTARGEDGGDLADEHMQLSLLYSKGSAKPEPERSPKTRKTRAEAKVKQAMRERRALGEVFKRRAARDNVREESATAQLTQKVFEQHGIRHHFRDMPKAGWFAGYMAGLDRNGMLALQTLAECNMPKHRRAAVLLAARSPGGYTPKRNTSSGKRSEEKRFEFDGRELGHDGHGGLVKDWTLDPEHGHPVRAESHPAFIMVIQCAVFLWLAKSRTSSYGCSYKVRGFGRGVFTSMCRCGEDAIFGHTRGVPGAMLALEQAGFVRYWQPPAEKVSPYDRGPSGHAYNLFWFKADSATRAIEELHDYIAWLSRLPLLERLQVERATAAAEARASPIPDAEIPF